MARNFLPFAVVGEADTSWGLSLAAILFAALWFRYKAKVAQFTSSQNPSGPITPPTFPYFFPLLGSLPLAYFWKPRDLILDPNSFFQSSTQSCRVKILHQEFYITRGAENVKAFFRAPVTTIPFVKFALGYAFGTSAKALSLYDKDDSGINHTPHPDSKVEPRNRIDYRVHHSTKSFLEGPGLNPLFNRYRKTIGIQLQALHQRLGGSEWRSHHDLFDLVTKETTIAILNALCGPHLLRLNPDFPKHADDFDVNLQTFMQGIPWFLAPGAYRARKRAINAIKQWQQHARDNFTPSALDENGDDEFWGSRIFRERHAMFLEMGDGEFDYGSMASGDFGFIWAMKNAITASAWTTYEIFRDKSLLSTVRAELSACSSLSDSGNLEIDTDHLLRSCPVLSAAYAETLRLRMHFYFLRVGDRGKPLPILNWLIPSHKPLVALTTVAHFDKTAWNTEYPLDVFWPGRFLTTDDEGNHVFSTKGLEGSWVPYGGGMRQCPGKHLAKRVIFYTTAMMVGMFDVDVVDDTVQENLTLWGFGSGVSRTLGRAGVKIRRRENTAP